MEGIRINGLAVAWANMSFPIYGIVVSEISEVEYSYSDEFLKYYGKGRKAIKRGRSKEDCTGSITISIELYNAIMAAIPKGKKIGDAQGQNIPIVYSEDGVTQIIHLLKDVRFAGAGISTKSGDGFIDVKIPLSIMDIVY